MKEIPGTKLLISLLHSKANANIEVFNLAKKGRTEKIYSFDEVVGCKFALQIIQTDIFTFNLLIFDIENNDFPLTIVTGFGDLTYNTKRNLLGAISLSGKIAHHLFSVDTDCVNTKESVKLLRKSKWHSQYTNERCKFDISLI